MSKVYYNQADSRWASYPYPSSSYPNATIKSGGCGPTSAAMVISSFKETILPNQMGDIFRQNGYRAASGTSGSAFPFVAKKWGLTCNIKVKLDDAVACLKRGGMVVANVRGGSVFSTGGHYIVLAYMKDDNTIAVFDPYMYANKFNTANRRNKVTVSGNTIFISYQNMKDYGLYSNLYCFEAPATATQNTNNNSIPKYNAGQQVVITTSVLDTGARQGDKIFIENTNMDRADRKQFWIHKSVLENNNSVLHALGVICYVEGKDYLMQVFNDQFWIKEENLSPREVSDNTQPNSTVGQVKKFKALTYIYSNSNLSGNKYTYKANTSIRILENRGNVDMVQVVQTGRQGFVSKNSYK